MLGFVSQGAPGPEEVIKIATAMAMPAAAKARLQDISQQLDILNRQRADIAALKAQADAAVLVNDKRAAEIEQRAAVLDAATVALNTRIAKFEATVAQFEQALARHEASLEQMP